MSGDRTSRSSFGPMPVGALRLIDELRRYKIDPDILVKIGSDQSQIDALTKVLRLASFVETNAEPLIMIDIAGKRVCYSNAAAVRKMPDLKVDTVVHPLLRGWESIPDEIKRAKATPICTEVSFGMTTYERKGFFEPSQNLIQLLFSEVHKQKDLTGSALVYPFPVIDYSLSLDFVTFCNSAARKCFPGLGRTHKILSGISSKAEKLRNVNEKTLIDNLEISGKIYQRAIVYIGQGDLLRIYATDVTQISRNWKVQLLTLAAKMQSGFEITDLKSFEASATAILASIRGEKIELGKLELDLNRLVVMLKNINVSQIKPYELESMKSVVAHFLESLYEE